MSRPPDPAAPPDGFATPDGLILFRRRWAPPGRPWAALILIHGLGEHSGLHADPAEWLAARGVRVEAFDLRGHGRSPGQRAWIRRWREYRDDLDRLASLVAREQPGTPVFLLGHSMGGLIALEWALTTPVAVRGVIAVSPPLGRIGIPAPLLGLARLASRIAPRLSLRTRMDLSGLALDPAVVARTLADPLFHRVGTARLATEYQAAVERVHELAPRLAVPTLLLHGADDPIAEPGGSRRFARRADAGRLTYIEYPGARHALLGDRGHERVLDDIMIWLRREAGR